MFARFGWLSTCLLAFLFVAACAEGVPAAPAEEWPADPTLGQPQPQCGNGMREGSEQCDCAPSVTTMCFAPEGVTCESLGMGTGTLYCAPGLCTYLTTGCSMGSPGGAGQGGGAGRSG